MLSNYLKIALRNLRKNPGYTFINVFGLAVGLACGLLILIFVRDELSYDRFHTGAERIHRIVLRGKMQDRELNAPVSPAPMAPTIAREFPEVEEATRLSTLADQMLVERGVDKQFLETRFHYADSSFFDVFTFQPIEGDLATALDAPRSLVLTESTARKYFPEGGAVGKTLTVSDSLDYRVTAVVEDVPSNAHFHFDLLATMTAWPPAENTFWVSNNLNSYLLLRENADPAAVQAKLPGLFRKYAGEQIQDFMNMSIDDFEKMGNRMSYELQPLTDIHLHSNLEFEIEPNGNIAYVYIFSAVGFFILLIACINFMNLATARSAGRAREVGMRKVLGSTRTQLIRQFLAESTVISLAALLLAVGFVAALVPLFNELSGKEITYASLLTPWVLLLLTGITAAVGLVAGSYPAFFLSSFEPISVLKGRFAASTRGVILRSTLVVFQFAISIALIVGTLVVYDQLRFVRKKALGFDREHVAVVRRAEVLGTQQTTFMDELRKDPNVASVSRSTTMPGGLFGGTVYRTEGENTSDHIMAPMGADYGWAETLGMEMKAGRFFSPDFPTDSTAFVINEAAAKKFGWENPIGERINFLGPNLSGEIIGVVKDFHYASLRNEINPLIINFAHVRTFGPPQPLPLVAVRLKPGDPAGGIAAIQKHWNAFAPGQPLEYSFLDSDFAELYEGDQRLGQVFTVFAVLAILIACLGLFGLASFATQQRTKEIGVRKTLGASVPGIVMLLSKEFTRLVLIAFVLAAPLAWLAMDRWLQDFAYRTDINVLTFIAAAVISFAIAWATVAYQSVRAATINPVNALRYE